ncbi:MAG: zinc-finger domain-containing protein [Gammaproteobacteria bacterium]|nr:zinc-finger domain-containing protein [Gammaproteobacteria bacterium]MDA8014379.1 zinc-finger domain-containing protein [Gammaproteobacteria bacterium]
MGAPQKNKPASDQPNASRRVRIGEDDLPLHCPMPGKRLWDSHPKVYLPIERGGEMACPYCGTVYTLPAARGRKAR